jgi:1-acyl-sn-glycerol-3-phosphate acyltransferase
VHTEGKSDDAREPKGPAAAPHFDHHAESRLAIQALKGFDVLFSRIYHQLDVLSPGQLPKTGPAILICNHTSGLDPLLIQAPLRRVVVWMMAKEYYELPILNRVFRTLEAIPVDRAARDTSAMRLALRALQDGRVLGIFPEGRIETKRELLPFQPGVAQMAVKAGVPVCPAFLDGTQHGLGDMIPAYFRRQEATIRFGPPIRLERGSGKGATDAATARLREAVWRLRTPRFGGE